METPKYVFFFFFCVGVSQAFLARLRNIETNVFVLKGTKTGSGKSNTEPRKWKSHPRITQRKITKKSKQNITNQNSYYKK